MESDSATSAALTDGNWEAGVLGGITGAAAMGILVLVMNSPTLAVAIPSLYGLAPPPSPGAGLVVHRGHGAVLGVVFATGMAVLGTPSVRTVVAAGLGWGVVTWGGLAAVVMPVWLSVVGSPASPPFPNFAPPSLLWHAVYGVVLGGVYAVTRTRV
jgi:hypothetical protein